MKKILCYILTLCLLMSSSICVFAQDENADTNSANENGIVDYSKSSILMCADTGDIIYEKNAYEHVSPASVTKLMSMLLVLEAIDSGKITLEDKVTAGENAVAMGGSQIWLEVGETMTVEELLKAVIVASANDACTALGEYIAGSSTAFVSMMNERANSLGLENTNFENCTGLDDTATNHYSCAYDLAVIASEVLTHELVFNYSTIWLDYLRDGETELNNTNKLVNTYTGITGLKTGTTSKAGFCVCATAKREDMNLIAVVLGAETGDKRFESAVNLLDFGFANYEIFVPTIDETQITNVKIKNGEEKTTKPIYSTSDKILVKKGTGEISYEYSVSEVVNAPIKKGDELGEILIKSGDQIIKKIPLYSGKDINKISFNFVLTEMLRNI